MKEVDKSKTININQTKRSKRTDKRDHKLNQANTGKTLNGKDGQSKASCIKSDSTVTLVSDSNTGTEPSEVYENVVIHYVDDVNRFEEPTQDPKANELVSKEIMEEVIDGHSTDLDKEPRQGKDDVSDSETTKDSVSSQGDPLTTEDEKVESVSRVAKGNAKKNSAENNCRGHKEKSDPETSRSQARALQTPKKSNNSNKKPSKVAIKSSSLGNSKQLQSPPKPSSESSEGVDDKPAEEKKGSDILDETSNGSNFDENSNGSCLNENSNGEHLDLGLNSSLVEETLNGACLDGTSTGAQSVGSDNDAADIEENGEHENEASLEQKIEEMEMRIEKLEEELREVAVLEISLYSVVPEHGSSAHKVHTPARRLSRLYIHACKQWTQDKRATIAKNTVSGLVLIAKSCGNDVPRYQLLVRFFFYCISVFNCFERK